MTQRAFFLFSVIATGLCVVSVLGAVGPKGPVPTTKTDVVVDRLHGVEIADPYRWLENAGDPEVKSWVDQQNASSRSLLDKIPFRGAIRERLGRLLDIGTIGTPVPV